MRYARENSQRVPNTNHICYRNDGAHQSDFHNLLLSSNIITIPRYLNFISRLLALISHQTHYAMCGVWWKTIMDINYGSKYMDIIPHITYANLSAIMNQLPFLLRISRSNALHSQCCIHKCPSA